MIIKPKSVNSNSIHLLILAVSLVAVSFADPYQLFASSNNDDDDDDDNDGSRGDGNDDSNNGDDSGSGGESRDDLISKLCRYAADNPLLAEMAASALGAPGGAGLAAGALCSLG